MGGYTLWFLRAVRKLTLGIVFAAGVVRPATAIGQDTPAEKAANAAPVPTRQVARDTAAKPTTKDTVRADSASGVSIMGRVIGLRGYRGAGILVSLTARTTSGDTIWSSATTTTASGPDSSHGEFAFVYPNTSKLSAAHLDLDLARQKVPVINDSWFRHGKWVRHEHLVIGAAIIDSSGRRAVRRDIALELDPAPPFYTFLLFFPALIGLIAATSALGVVSRRGGHQGSWTDGTKKAKNALLGYTVAGTGAWVIVVAYFAIGFVTSGLRKISLFDPDISIPVILPVSAFIGVLVYATECLVGVVRKKEDPAVTGGHTFVDYQQTLIELGNRVFIAPYVAIIAVLTVFRGTADGLAVPFIAFFTGLWIEPVLRALRLAGEKLLPSEKDKPSDDKPVRQTVERDAASPPKLDARDNGGAQDEVKPKPSPAGPLVDRPVAEMTGSKS